MRHNSKVLGELPRAVRYSSFVRRVWCDTELPPDLVETLCRGDVENILFGSIPLQVKDRCVVGRCEIGSHSLLIKRHTWGDVSRTLRMAFRESAASSCGRLGVYLHNLGIPTPRPRATADFRIGPWTYRSYLISDYVEGTSLYRYIRRGSQSEYELRHLAGQVAQIWQRLVELGVSHCDFKPENFIVDEQLKVWLIDLEKVRIRGKVERQRQRQIFDAVNFLHIRSWHKRPEARTIFANAFLQMPHGILLRASGVERVAAGLSLHESERDAELSVLVVCDDNLQVPQVKFAIDSVQDIADEIVLVAATNGERLEVLKRIDLCDHDMPASISTNSFVKLETQLLLRCNWVLALQQNECVTPFLAKELQQQLADAKDNAALRIRVERRFFGRSVAQAGELPIRLFRQPACTSVISGGKVIVTAREGSIGSLTGTIQANEVATVSDFVDRLNEASDAAAIRRRNAGQRPRLIRGGWQAARQLIAASLRKSGIRSGWAGIQIAALEAAFVWIEEAKLYQLIGEFHRVDSTADVENPDDRELVVPARANAA